MEMLTLIIEFSFVYHSFFKPQSYHAIRKKERWKSRCPAENVHHRMFHQVCILLVVYRHPLPFPISASFFFSFSFISQWGSEVCSVHQCGLRVCGGVLPAGSLCMSVADPQICGRSLRDAILDSSPQMQFRSDYITSQNTFRNGVISSSTSKAGPPTWLTSVLSVTRIIS